MDNGIKKLFQRLLIFIIPYISFSLLLIPMIKKDPMRFYDGEYAWYRQNKEIAQEQDSPCRVLIMGDSVSKAGWVPSVLSEYTYNYSLGGATPIEEYYCLYEYLQNNRAPEYLIYSQGLDHFCVAECFWTRGVYFHRLNARQALDVFMTSRRIEGADAGLFETKGLLDILLYYRYSPVYYSSAFLKGLVNSREPVNETFYQEARDNKGQVYFSVGYDGDIIADDIVKENSFHCDELIDYYFRKIIDLCQEYDIKFIYQSCPLTEITYTNLNDEFIEGYYDYCEELRNSYPEIQINAELFCYSDDQFNDAMHLSKEGATRFSLEMRDRYENAFS